jgi:VanZ family protein
MQSGRTGANPIENREPETSKPVRPRRVDPLLWLVAWVSAAITLYFSFGAIPPGTDTSSRADEVWHVIAYVVVVFSFLLTAVWRPGRGGGRLPGAAAIIVLGAVIIGIAIEFIQAFTGRDAEVVDVVADLLGALIGFGAWGLVRAIAGRRRTAGRR